MQRLSLFLGFFLFCNNLALCTDVFLVNDYIALSWPSAVKCLTLKQAQKDWGIVRTSALFSFRAAVVLPGLLDELQHVLLLKKKHPLLSCKDWRSSVLSVSLRSDSQRSVVSWCSSSLWLLKMDKAEFPLQTFISCIVCRFFTADSVCWMNFIVSHLVNPTVVLLRVVQHSQLNWENWVELKSLCKHDMEL